MDTVRAVWIHSSPNWIEPGAFVTSAAERGVTPRTFPAGDMDDAVAKGWYDPSRVYILRSDVDPTNHLGRFAFSTRDRYMYEVERTRGHRSGPRPLGPTGLALLRSRQGPAVRPHVRTGRGDRRVTRPATNLPGRRR